MSDPRWELIRQLVAYKKFKLTRPFIFNSAKSSRKTFFRACRCAKQGRHSSRPPPKQEATIFDLINAINDVLKRVSQREDLREIFEDKWSVSEKDRNPCSS